MKLTGISNRGLMVISLLVVFLWGIIFAERAIVRQAQREHHEFLRSLPAGAPANPKPQAPQRATPGPGPGQESAYS
jgi:hypothetical protein